MFLSRVVLSMLSVVALLFSFSAAQDAEQASGGFVDAQVRRTGVGWIANPWMLPIRIVQTRTRKVCADDHEA
jgi:hypothetical protein